MSPWGILGNKPTGDGELTLHRVALLPQGVLLPALTQFLPGWPCPRGPWYGAVCRGGAQPATAGEGGGGGPEELGVFVGLGAVVLAARLRVGGCWCRHGCT